MFYFLRQQHSEAATSKAVQLAMTSPTRQRYGILIEEPVSAPLQHQMPVSLSAYYTRDGAKIGRLTLALIGEPELDLRWRWAARSGFPLQRCYAPQWKR